MRSNQAQIDRAIARIQSSAAADTATVATIERFKASAAGLGQEIRLLAGVPQNPSSNPGRPPATASR